MFYYGVRRQSTGRRSHAATALYSAAARNWARVTVHHVKAVSREGPPSLACHRSPKRSAWRHLSLAPIHPLPRVVLTGIGTVSVPPAVAGGLRHFGVSTRRWLALIHPLPRVVLTVLGTCRYRLRQRAG